MSNRVCGFLSRGTKLSMQPKIFAEDKVAHGKCFLTAARIFFKQYSVVYAACSICPLLVSSLKTTESIVHVIRSSKILVCHYGPTSYAFT